MEEVTPSAASNSGQFQAELPESFSVSKNTSQMNISNLEVAHDINILPLPEGENQPGPEVTHSNQISESEFDKRNERFRGQSVDSDDIAAAGMVALGDVLKKRQSPDQQPIAPVAAPPRTYAPLPPPTPMPQPMPVPSPVIVGQPWSLYKQAVVVGITAALIIAPIVIVLLVRR